MHPCTRAQLSDTFHGWEVRASAQPTNAPAQTQPHYPLPNREVRNTKLPAQTPSRATRHSPHLTNTTPGPHLQPWNVPGTCLPIPSKRSPPNMGSRPPRPHFSSSSSESSLSISTTLFFFFTRRMIEGSQSVHPHQRALALTPHAARLPTPPEQGNWPAAPGLPRLSNSETATALAAEHASKLHHLLYHATSALARRMRGAAGGPSGMTAEHLRVLLDSPSCTSLLGEAASRLAQGNIPEEVVTAIRLGRMTALQKPDGGVRGIVVGDVFRSTSYPQKRQPVDERPLTQISFHTLLTTQTSNHSPATTNLSGTPCCPGPPRARHLSCG